jgi:hypothetical protein
VLNSLGWSNADRCDYPISIFEKVHPLSVSGKRRKLTKLGIIMDVTKPNLFTCIVLMVNYMRMPGWKRRFLLFRLNQKFFQVKINFSFVWWFFPSWSLWIINEFLMECNQSFQTIPRISWDFQLSFTGVKGDAESPRPRITRTDPTTSLLLAPSTQRSHSSAKCEEFLKRYLLGAVIKFHLAAFTFLLSLFKSKTSNTVEITQERELFKELFNSSKFH